MELLIYFIIWILTIIAAYKIANNNNMNEAGWVIGATLFGFASVVVQIIVLLATQE